jgi:hypothetical protein
MWFGLILDLWIRHCKFLVAKGMFEDAMKVFERGMRAVQDKEYLQDQYRFLVTG